MPGTRLLLISRDDILAVMASDASDKAFRRLATLTRQGGYHLLATAPQPTEWTGEHGSPDDALLGPNSIRRRLADAGGTLDGVYYVRRSTLTQKRNRDDALLDILRRYATQPEQTVLLSSSRNWVKAAQHHGLRATLLGRENELVQELTRLLEERPPAEA